MIEGDVCMCGVVFVFVFCVGFLVFWFFGFMVLWLCGFMVHMVTCVSF